jgi:hypothetical protein
MTARRENQTAQLWRVPAGNQAERASTTHLPNHPRGRFADLLQPEDVLCSRHFEKGRQIRWPRRIRLVAGSPLLIRTARKPV